MVSASNIVETTRNTAWKINKPFVSLSNEMTIAKH